MNKKFDVCYLPCKGGCGFHEVSWNFRTIESRHEVDIGPAYRSDTSAQQFTHYIAQSQREGFLKYFSSRLFFSFMVDGTTDSGNLEDKLIIVLYCKKDDVCDEIRSCTYQVPSEVLVSCGLSTYRALAGMFHHLEIQTLLLNRDQFASFLWVFHKDSIVEATSLRYPC